MHEIRVLVDPESPDRRRHRRGAIIKTDSRSEAYRRLPTAGEPLPIRDVRWQRHIPILNQDKPVTVNGRVWRHGTGSCGVNSLLGVVSTGPFTPPFLRPTEQETVVPIYENLSARLGPGYAFPPHDTGCSITDAMAYAQEQGWIASYYWPSSFEDMLQALMTGPVQVSFPWYDSFDRDATSYRCPVKGTSYDGWHAVCFDTVDTRQKRLWFANSWGRSWCAKGWGYMTYGDVRRLFDRQQIQVAAPQPVPAAA